MVVDLSCEVMNVLQLTWLNDILYQLNTNLCERRVYAMQLV